MINPDQICQNIHHEINNYLIQQDIYPSIVFESRRLLTQSSIMFTLTFKEGLFKEEQVKSIFPYRFITEQNMSIIVELFKDVINSNEKINVTFENDSFQEEVTKLAVKGGV